MSSEIEKCKNPFRKRRCDRTDIEVYIIYKGIKKPICSLCWKKIAKSDLEWGEDDPMEVVKKVVKKRHEVLKKLNRGSKKYHK